MTTESRDLGLVRELWTTSIDTQLRLAALSARTRQIGLAIVTGSLVVAAVAGSYGSAQSLAIGSAHLAVHPAVLVLGLAALALVGLALVDAQHEYMLRGAMKFTEDLEEKCLNSALGGDVARGLSQSIARERPDEARMRRWRTWSVAVPGATALLLLIGGNLPSSTPSATTTAQADEMPEVEPTTMASPVPMETAAATDPAAAAVTAPVAATAPATAPVAAPATAAAPVAAGAAAKPGAKTTVAPVGAKTAAAPAAGWGATTKAAPVAPAAAEPAKTEAAPAAEAPKAEPKPEPVAEAPKPEPKPEPAPAESAPPPAQP